MTTSLLHRFGPGTGAAIRPTPYSGPQSFIFPANSTPQTVASSSFNGNTDSDHPAPEPRNEQHFGHNADTQGQEPFDQHGMVNMDMEHNFGSSDTPPNPNEFSSRNQSPITDEPPSPHGQASGGQRLYGHGHTPLPSRDYTSSASSPAPTLAGTRRPRGNDDSSSFSQLRSGSTTHQLRAFATRTTVDLKLSRTQSDELVKMAEVCFAHILLCVLAR